MTTNYLVKSDRTGKTTLLCVDITYRHNRGTLFPKQSFEFQVLKSLEIYGLYRESTI